jgi:hypothetical protein
MASMPIKISRPSRSPQTYQVRLKAACGIPCPAVCLSAAGYRCRTHLHRKRIGHREWPLIWTARRGWAQRGHRSLGPFCYWEEDR